LLSGWVWILTRSTKPNSVMKLLEITQLQKALLQCFVIHTVLVTVLISCIVLSRHGVVLLSVDPVSAISIIVIPMPGVAALACAILFMYNFDKALKKIAPDVRASISVYGTIDLIRSFRPLIFALSEKDDNDDLNKVRGYARCYYLLFLLFFVEALLVLIQL